MFQENLKTLRKKKGMTQEELAARLHVVRQTISKWEKGTSVPDAEMLVKLAEILEAPVGQLLGAPIEAEAQPDVLAEQLARINEQLAIKNRRAKRIWTAVAVIIGCAIALHILLIGLARVFSFTPYPASDSTTYHTFAQEEVYQRFPEYLGLNTAKGLEVYVWQTAENTYYCGVLSGTDREKTPEEISGLAANGATVEEMKIILSSYDVSNESISILPCKQSVSDYAYQIDDAYIQKITELFAD